MRIMPFMKRKNGVQFAGVGLDTGGGGGGGGGGSNITFSTDEFETPDTWIDGRKIYGRIINGFSANSLQTKYDALTNVRQIIWFFPMRYITASGGDLNHQYVFQGSEGNTNVKKKSNGNVDVQFYNAGGNDQGFVMIFYTKL